MKRLFCFVLCCAFGCVALLLGGQGQAEENAKTKPVGYRLLTQDKGRVVMLSAEGNVEWEYPCKFTSHDIALLSNGNFLLHTGPGTVQEVTPDKKVVWEYIAKPVPPYSGAVEIHGFQRFANGRTMIAETGNKRIIEVDREGNIVSQTPLTVDKPDSHRDTRLVRKLDNGNYLVAHEGDGMVREYEPSGKVVWSYTVDLDGRERTPGHEGHGTEVYSAYRLKNGNTLIGTGNGNRVIEVNPRGEVVWKVGYDELPGIRFHWITMLQKLPNGNIVIGNAHAGPDNPQLVEVTHDKNKRVVWTFKNWDILGNDTVATQILGVRGKILR